MKEKIKKIIEDEDALVGELVGGSTSKALLGGVIVAGMALLCGGAFDK